MNEPSPRRRRWHHGMPAAFAVLDTSGRPFAEFWVEARPVDKGIDSRDWPTRWKDFPDGTAQRRCPRRRSRSRCTPGSASARRWSGPFDPLQLPARIDVTLPD